MSPEAVSEAMRSQRCSRCKAIPGERCMTARGNPTTYHTARWYAAVKAGLIRRPAAAAAEEGNGSG